MMTQYDANIAADFHALSILCRRGFDATRLLGIGSQRRRALAQNETMRTSWESSC